MEEEEIEAGKDTRYWVEMMLSQEAGGDPRRQDVVTGLEEQKSPFMTQAPSPTTTGSTQ